MLYPAMDVQKPSEPQAASDPFGASLSDAEFALLRTFAMPAAIEALTPEQAHLKNLGLIFVDAASGVAQLSPLGKAWLLSQRRFILK